MHAPPPPIRLAAFLLAICGAIPLAGGGCRDDSQSKQQTTRPPHSSITRPTSPTQPTPPTTGDSQPVETGAGVRDQWFRDLTGQSGIDFHHVSGTNAEKPFPAANGSGLAALDYDRDGRIDLYFLTGTPFPLAPSPTSPRNRIFRNLGSGPEDWHFEDVTDSSGLGHNGYSAGVAVGDYDADGFSDVYVACFGANRLFRNQGDGSFQDVSQAAGVADARWGTSAAFLDFDNDGLLDIYVCNYAKWSWETNRFCGDRERNVRLYCSPQSVEPAGDILYRNLGDGRFEDVTAPSQIDGRPARSQGVVAADLNGDQHIDIYVGNDLHPNTLLINQGNGQFQDETEISGAGYDSLGSAQAGMGVEVADVNADGRLDLFVTNFQGETNALYVNEGNALFYETSQRLGLTGDSLPWIGWGTAFVDFDLDQDLDVIVTNGHVDDNRQLLGQDAPYQQPPGLWRNVAGRFEFWGGRGGDYFREVHTGRALVAADLDNDGDSDVVIGHQDATPALLANQHRPPRAGKPAPAVLAVQLVGTRSNRDAIGSFLRFTAGNHTQIRAIHGGGSYLSAPALERIFAVDRKENSLQLEITWPAGGRSLLENLQPDHRYLIIEPSSSGSETHYFARRIAP